MTGGSAAAVLTAGGARSSSGAADPLDRAHAGSRSWSAATALGAAALVGALAADEGGYGAASWNWAALVLAWSAALALVLRPSIRMTRLEAVSLTAFAGFAAWTALSAVWSVDPSQSLLEAQRSGLYAVAAAAAVLVVRRSGLGALLGATLAALTLVAAFALATRLLPDRVGSFDADRLQEPIGYWNGLGLFAVLGLLLALGAAARADGIAARVAAGAAAVVLAPTLYFTFSRGAWVALAVGVATAVAVDRRRLQLLATAIVLAAAPALAVWAAARSPAIVNEAARYEDAVRNGHALALALLPLAALGALAVGALALAERRVAVGRRARQAFAAVLVVALLVPTLVVVVRHGGPVELARTTYDRFRAPPPPPGGDLNARLFNLSNDGRIDAWGVAVDELRAHPLAGSGASTYEQHWLRHRPIEFKVRNAHNLYLETAATLGAVGLGLLLVALAAPLAALPAARAHALAAPAAGAYVAFLAHAAIDWDWQLTGVTLPALVCGTALLVAARRGAAHRLRPRMRGALVGVAVCVAIVALVSVVGNSALAAGRHDYDVGDSRAAERHARRAVRWMPWSAAPLQLLGEAQLANGDEVSARGSLRRALARAPGDWSIWFDLAQTGDGREQQDALRRARLLNPRSPEIADYLADRAARAQQTAQAEAAT